MRATLSLMRREFTAYFLSPVAYVVLTGFLLVTGYFFYLTLGQLTESGPRGTEFPMRAMLGDEKFWFVFVVIPPLLTMRSFAEERATGTLEMLMTAPIRDWQVVLAKFAAAFGFYIVLWLPTLVYLPVLLDMRVDWTAGWTVSTVTAVVGAALVLLMKLMFVAYRISPLTFGLYLLGLAALVGGVVGHLTQDEPPFLNLRFGIDPYPALSTYLGLLLVGAMFLALGLFVSSLVRSQLVSALVALLLGSVFLLIEYLKSGDDSGSLFGQIITYFSIHEHFAQEFTRGLVDTRHLVLYASLTIFFLFLAIRSLEARRWR